MMLLLHKYFPNLVITLRRWYIDKLNEKPNLIIFLLLSFFSLVVVLQLILFMVVITEDFNQQHIHSSCMVPEWNTITMQEVPHAVNFKSWADLSIGVSRQLLFAEVRLLSAFVYKDQIAIITTSQHHENHTVIQSTSENFMENKNDGVLKNKCIEDCIKLQHAMCRYYDCNRIEIPDTKFITIVFPMTVAICPRRYGAEFVSLSFGRNGAAHEPVPLIYRAYDEPIHELSVCVGPLYGEESKWLEILEYVEHYKLLGVSFFYFTLFNMNPYDHKVVDYYAKFGYAEFTHYMTEYNKLNWMFHPIQTQECHYRSRYHSKWVINVDIDERLIYTGHDNLLHLLRSMPPTIGELSFSTNRVLKTEQIPQKLKKLNELQSELMFLKYNKTTEITWYNLKGIIRPELVFVLFYHWSYRQEENIQVMSVPKRVAHLRHYRNVDKTGLNGNWLQHYNASLIETRLDPLFEANLIRNVQQKAKYVYDQKVLYCEKKAC